MKNGDRLLYAANVTQAVWNNTEINMDDFNVIL